MAQAAQREVTRTPVLLRDAVQRSRQHVRLTGQGCAQHQVPRLVGYGRKGAPLTREPGVELIERAAVGGIDEQASGNARKLVAHRTVNGPVLGQPFAWFQDLLDHDIDWQACGKRLPIVLLAIPGFGQHGIDRLPVRLFVIRGVRERAVGGSLQIAVVASRVPETVRVIDTQAGNGAVRQQLQQPGMRGREDLALLLTYGSQLIDGEEAAVVDLFPRRTKGGEAVALGIQQLIERIEAVGLLGSAIDPGDASLDGSCNLWRGCYQVRDAALDDDLLAATLGQFLRIGCRRSGQSLARRDDAGQFQLCRVLLIQCTQELQRRGQDERVGWRGDRQRRLVVVDRERAVCKGKLKFSAFQDHPVGITEDRQQNLAAQLFLQRTPVDIKIGGVDGGAAILQQVLPPGVRAGSDPHVVRDDVNQETHVVRAQVVDQRLQVTVRANLRVDGGVVRDVIAVHAARCGGEEGRGVERANAQLPEIRHDALGIRKRECGVELDTIGGRRQFRYRTRRLRGQGLTSTEWASSTDHLLRKIDATHQGGTLHAMERSGVHGYAV